MGIVVGIDGSAASAAALRWALAEAAVRRTSVVLVHAWLPRPGDMADETSLRSDAVALLDSAAEGVAAERVAVRGMAASALLDAARSAELLVLGASENLGNVTRHVVTHATCPVVLVPA